MRNIKNKNLIIFMFLAVAVGLMVLGPKVAAVTFTADGNPGDTPSGEAVTAYATNETLAYKSGTIAQDTLEAPSNVAHQVLPEYGFSINKELDAVYVTPGDLVSVEGYWITNEGNARDIYKLESYYTYGGGANNWVVELWLSPSTYITTIATGGYNSTQEVDINEDLDAGRYFYLIRVPSSTTEAPNGSNIVIDKRVTTAKSPYGQYQGGNDYYYGGINTDTTQKFYYTSAPILTLTRTFTVDAPALGGYSGGTHEAVPGSVITFTMTYSNEGAGDANSIVLVDKVPANTNLAHFNKSGAQTYVNITAGQGNATGWTVYTTTEASPSKAYNAAGWTLIGTISSSSNYWPVSGTYATTEVRWVKWQKATVADTEDTQKLTWGVTIR